MPELPEIEVLRLSLLPLLPGRSVVRSLVRSLALRQPLDRRGLSHHLEGRTVTGLRRRAKYLLIDLSGGSTLVVHLGMSGQLTLVAGQAPVERHEHVAFELDSGQRLRLVDPRRFGMVFAAETDRLGDHPSLAHLGVEPLGSELSGAYLAARARGRRGPVKNYLMDGRIVVGVGNIYASESLWRAGVHPKRSVGRVAPATWDRLAEAVRAVLGQAIAEGGTTLADFTDGGGNAGYFQVSLAVYGREGGPCPSCERPIKRVVLGGRSTFYCPGCQH